VAVSRCYRPEACARGRDTKGLYRVHEFTSGRALFAWTLPDNYVAQRKPNGYRNSTRRVQCWRCREQKQQIAKYGPAIHPYSSRDVRSTETHLRAPRPSTPRTHMPMVAIGGKCGSKYDIEAFLSVPHHSPWRTLFIVTRPTTIPSNVSPCRSVRDKTAGFLTP